MIINIERKPDFSLYYLGSILLAILEQVTVISIEDLLSETQNQSKERVHVDFIYYALDWLFLLSIVRIEEGLVYYENKEIDSTQNETF